MFSAYAVKFRIHWPGCEWGLSGSSDFFTQYPIQNLIVLRDYMYLIRYFLHFHIGREKHSSLF